MPEYLIEIGNTDNKLTQQAWAEFVMVTNEALAELTECTYFHGFSPAAAPWQNAAWHVVIPVGGYLGLLRNSLSRLARRFDQESISCAQVVPSLVFAATESPDA